MNTAPPTPVSLLERLRGPENPHQRQQDWQKFVELYAPLLYRCGRYLKLQDQDANELVQEVIVHLFRELARFAYDPDKGRFRSWLWKVTVHKWSEMRQAFPERRANDKELAELASPDSVDALREAEYRDYLVHRAWQVIQTDFNDTTRKAFQRYVIDGLSAAEVAAELVGSEEAVRQAKWRVLKRLRAELEGLLD